MADPNIQQNTYSIDHDNVLRTHIHDGVDSQVLPPTSRYGRLNTSLVDTTNGLTTATLNCSAFTSGKLVVKFTPDTPNTKLTIQLNGSTASLWNYGGFTVDNSGGPGTATFFTDFGSITSDTSGVVITGKNAGYSSVVMIEFCGSVGNSFTPGMDFIPFYAHGYSIEDGGGGVQAIEQYQGNYDGVAPITSIKLTFTGGACDDLKAYVIV